MAREPKPDPYLIDSDNPELSEAELAAMRPAHEMLPASVFAELVRRKPGQRGPGKAPAKTAITLRLDPELLADLKATGPGWQVLAREMIARGLAGRRRRVARKAAAPALGKKRA